MASATRKITLAAPYKDAEGKTHKAGSTVEVETGEASRLLFEGLARKADTKPAASAAKNEKGA